MEILKRIYILNVINPIFFDISQIRYFFVVPQQSHILKIFKSLHYSFTLNILDIVDRLDVLKRLNIDTLGRLYIFNMLDILDCYTLVPLGPHFVDNHFIHIRLLGPL